MTDFALREASACAYMEVAPGGIVQLRMVGCLTVDVLSGFAQRASAIHADARGFILDYRASAIAATEDELGLMVVRTPHESPIRRPGAFLVRTGMGEVLQGHAVGMAHHGFVRRVFTDPARALAWVQVEASLRDRALAGRLDQA